jgi:hypothetical protein
VEAIGFSTSSALSKVQVGKRRINQRARLLRIATNFNVVGEDGEAYSMRTKKGKKKKKKTNTNLLE